jgi:rfaE bifunctional protein kinase chain/domain
MTLGPLDPRRAAELVARFSGLPVLIVGDVMLDRFIVGSVTRISPEAPVPVVRFRSEHLRLGGAANVAHNIAAFGGRVSLVGLVGADAAAAKLRGLLTAAGIRGDGLVEDRERPTTEKVRVVTERNQQVVRIDYESDVDAHGDVKQALLGRVKSLGRDMKTLLVSDYLKGTVSRTIIEALVAIKSASGVPLIVDPKIPHLDYYGGATLVTPNHHEAEAATHRPIRTDDDARKAGRDLRARVRSDAVLITRGEHGMWLSDREVEGSIPAEAREVSDVTGAGDTVAATLALALAAGGTFTEAALLANHAAGIVVGRFGAAIVKPRDLLESLNSEL